MKHCFNNYKLLDSVKITHLVKLPPTVIRFLAHLSKSNSRTFQGLSRTIRRIYIRRTKLKQTGTFISTSRLSGPLKSGYGVWRSAVSSPSGVRGGALVANAFLWH